MQVASHRRGGGADGSGPRVRAALRVAATASVLRRGRRGRGGRVVSSGAAQPGARGRTDPAAGRRFPAPALAPWARGGARGGGVRAAVGGLGLRRGAGAGRGGIFPVPVGPWGRLGYFRFGAPGRRGWTGGLDVPFEPVASRLLFVLMLLVS